MERTVQALTVGHLLGFLANRGRCPSSGTPAQSPPGATVVPVPRRGCGGGQGVPLAGSQRHPLTRDLSMSLRAAYDPFSARPTACGRPERASDLRFMFQPPAGERFVSASCAPVLPGAPGVSTSRPGHPAAGRELASRAHDVSRAVDERPIYKTLGPPPHRGGGPRDRLRRHDAG